MGKDVQPCGEGPGPPGDAGRAIWARDGNEMNAMQPAPGGTTEHSILLCVRMVYDKTLIFVCIA